MSSFGGEAWWQDDRSLRAGGETTDEEGSTSRVDISLGTDDDDDAGRPWAESSPAAAAAPSSSSRKEEPSTTNLAQSRLDAQLKSLPLANQYGGQYDAISYEQRAPGEGEPSIKGDDQTVGSSLGGGPSITQSRSGGGMSGVGDGVGGGDDSVAPYSLRGTSHDDDGDSYGYGSSLMGGDDSVAAEGSVPNSAVMNESIMNALGASGAGAPKTPPPKGSKSSKVKVKPSSSSNDPNKPRAAPALVPSPTKTANTAASSSTELNAEEDPIGYAAGYAEGIKAAKVEARRQRRRRFLILLLVLLALLVAAMIAVAAVTRFAFFDGQANGAQGAGGTETSTSSEGGRGGGDQEGQQGGSAGRGDSDSDDQGEAEAVVTLSPTLSPTDAPTSAPTSSPVAAPTTYEPTNSPTTSSPTATPTISAAPTTAEWANRPTTMEPTFAPTTMEPTFAPTTSSPTVITSSPTSSPTASPSISLPPTFPQYTPGELTETSQDGNLFLAGGLASRVLASSKEFVSLKGGEQSGERYHSNVRGRGATFVLPDGFLIPKNIPEEAETAEGTDDMAIANFAEDLHKRYAYVTNSDLRNGGGESGSIFFSPDGQPLAYLTVLDNADEPSGSGTTPWGTWIACEDNDEDEYKIWEVDPFGRREASETVLGSGGQFECAGFAYDDRDDKDIYFYMTQYDGDGPVRRYVPPRDAMNSKEDRAFRLLHAEGGTWEYLVFEPMEDETEGNADEGEGDNADQEGDGDTDGSSGTLRPISSGRILWTEDEALGRESAEEHFPRTRGIVRHGYQLFFASEDSEGSGGNGQGRTPLGGRIAVIDLDEWTYKAYDAGEMLDGGSPDEMVTLTKGGVMGGGGPAIHAPMEGRNNHGHKGGAHRNFSSGSPILFVTDHLPDNSRDAGGGVVAFDPLDGSYRRIFRAEDNDNWVTGVAFSPDGTRMYAALVDGQNVDNPDLLYEVTRADGRGFGEM